MTAPIPAATVILVREARAGVEVFLVKRHRKSSFMSNAFVFPGGKVDPADGGPVFAAIRELYEEAGILLATPPEAAARAAIEHRARLLGGELSFAVLLAGEGLVPDQTRLHWWANWVTPSAEPRRFDTDFFVAVQPREQNPSYDRKETVEELWISPAAALEKQASGLLRLAPPQLRTFHELAALEAGIPSLLAAAARRQEQRAAICPRIVQVPEGIAILLPWDRAYSEGEGGGDPIPPTHPIATPPSRFVWNGTSWRAM